MAHICPDSPHCPICHVERIELDNAKLRAEVEQLTKHAKEGWDLAATRAGQWKAADLQNEAMQKVCDAAIAFEVDQATYARLVEAVEGYVRGLPEKPVGEKPRDRNRCYCGGGTEHCKMCGAEPCKCAEKRICLHPKLMGAPKSDTFECPDCLQTVRR